MPGSHGSSLVGAMVLLGSMLGSPPAQASSFGRCNLIVQSQAPGPDFFRITEFQLDGQDVQVIVPAVPPDWPVPPGALERPRDIVVGEDGLLHLFHGTLDPWLSTYDPEADSWSHMTAPDWSTCCVVSYGGIARFGNQVFVTDQSNSDDPTSGVIVFDISTSTSTAFAPELSPIDLIRGLDGRLWVLDWAGTHWEAHAFDPETHVAQGSVSLAAAGPDIRGIAVDSNGDFFAADSDFPSGRLLHLSPHGMLLDTLELEVNPTDIALTASGLLAFGTSMDEAWLTDTSFSAPVQLHSIYSWFSFVGFVPGPLVCPGNTNGDCAVDLDDLMNVILDWGGDGSANGGDVNGSGQVDVEDLVEVFLEWGDCE